MSAPPALRLIGVTKSYADAGSNPRAVLRGVELSVERGRSVAIIGRSGSGKSTLLHLAAGIDLPDAGQVVVDGRDLGPMGDRERAHLRRDTIGLVFQFFYLLPHLSVHDNVALPAMIAGRPWSEVTPRVRELLARVELADRAGDSAQKLSGGEMQRVAICRALLLRPTLLLADEPTGNLDSHQGAEIMTLIRSLAKAGSVTVLLVTHSQTAAQCADYIWTMQDGRLVSRTSSPALTGVA